MTLGELIEESRGKTTNERVLDVDPPKVVTSFKMEGNFKGTLCTEIGSYTAVLGEGGILQGEGYGIITSKDGQGMATWKGQEKSVSVAQYSLKYLQQLREENCQISITWLECLNMRLTKTEIAPLKPGNGNRQRPRLLNPLTLGFRYFLITALTKKLIARTAYQEFLSFLNFYGPVSLNKIMFMSKDVTLMYGRAFFMDPL